MYATTKKAVVKKDVKSKVVAKKGYVEFKENGKRMGMESKNRNYQRKMPFQQQATQMHLNYCY